MYKLRLINNDWTEEIKKFDNINELHKAIEAASQLRQLGLINDFKEEQR